MKIVLRLSVVLISTAVLLSACQKEVSVETGGGGGNNGGGGGGNNGGNNYNASCNNTVMKIKRMQATFDTEDFIAAEWNADGTIHSIDMHEPFTEQTKATYIYSGGKITQAVLEDNVNVPYTAYDTVIFRYNVEGKVDSMYRKNSSGFGIKLSYTNGKLVRYTRYDDNNTIMFYWTVTTDAKDNVVKADEFSPSNATYAKESTYTYTRDDRKNPLAGLAPYMMHLDDDYAVFRHWGPNNYTDQRYQDFSGTGIDLTTGNKFTYNNNCYPSAYQNTIYGQPVLTGDDFVYTYY
jgi:hypothetical protein